MHRRVPSASHRTHASATISMPPIGLASPRPGAGRRSGRRTTTSVPEAVLSTASGRPLHPEAGRSATRHRQRCQTRPPREPVRLCVRSGSPITAAPASACEHTLSNPATSACREPPSSAVSLMTDSPVRKTQTATSPLSRLPHATLTSRGCARLRAIDHTAHRTGLNLGLDLSIGLPYGCSKVQWI
jgi:hypothetical protein